MMSKSMKPNLLLYLPFNIISSSFKTIFFFFLLLFQHRIPRTINGNQEIHHVVPQQPQGINPPPPPQLHHHGHHHPASSPHHAAPNPTPTTTTNSRHPPRTTTSKIMGNHSELKIKTLAIDIPHILTKVGTRSHLRFLVT